MDVRFCIGRNLRREAQSALEGILIRSNARSPKRARTTRAFRLTLTYMEVGLSYTCQIGERCWGKPVFRTFGLLPNGR
jgi:hypothetical protein